MLKRVHNAHYWTNNMEEAVGFYRDVLGLNMTVRFEDDWAEFDVGGTAVAVHGPAEGVAPPQGGATVVFEVDDLDVTIRALRSRGVHFEGDVFEVPATGRFASFRDPDGNLLQIFQRGTGEGVHHVTDEGWT
jgi:predicted enzyme related to lactoylglutathione lyase